MVDNPGDAISPLQVVGLFGFLMNALLHLARVCI